MEIHGYKAFYKGLINRYGLSFEEGKTYTVESAKDEKDMAVRFEDKWFKTVDDFFNSAKIGDELLIRIYRKLYDFEVISR